MAPNEPRFEMVSLTDPGMTRHLNEDAVFCDPILGLAILADGMGGYSTGEVASALAIETVSQAMQESIPGLYALPADESTKALCEDIAFAVERANAAIWNESKRESDADTMGSTIVVAVFLRDRVTIAHVGDSRLYRYRCGELVQMTRDHSWLQEQLDLGIITPENARDSRFKNLVTRGLGIEQDVDVEIHDYPVLAGDLFLICSDGLTDMLETHALAHILDEHIQDLPQAASEMVRQANANGGRDNISVILIRKFAPTNGWLRNLSNKLGFRKPSSFYSSVDHAVSRLRCLAVAHAHAVLVARALHIGVHGYNPEKLSSMYIGAEVVIHRSGWSSDASMKPGRQPRKDSSRSLG